ncbi:hypothetical protein GCM10025857_25850 [Alicyclobacillus contaminans]|uniref:hypothetical protein n=1 Tax=Alicyclobacillus contaminans TaxID=392016 RepID=UPI00041B4695|nr:hypothetical protein [Alicyclobacillus contaminans]GMA51228.1 hypothetical protein GCM10025857_25850 [Alicyclobacillus contaminans]
MTTFAKSAYDEAVAFLKDAGFEQQHPLMYHRVQEIGNYWYIVTVGLEDVDEQSLQATIHVLQRPLPRRNLGYGNGALPIRHVSPTQAPQVIQSLVERLQQWFAKRSP